jgi:hypothetical protein
MRRSAMPRVELVVMPRSGPPEATPENGGLQLSAKGKFDVYSAALVVLQMCFPGLWTAHALRRMNSACPSPYEHRMPFAVMPFAV